MLHSCFFLFPHNYQSLFCLCAFCPSSLKCFSHASSCFFCVFKYHILCHLPLSPSLIKAACYFPPRLLIISCTTHTVICNCLIYSLIYSFPNEHEAPWRQELCILTTLSPASMQWLAHKGTSEAISWIRARVNGWMDEWISWK